MATQSDRAILNSIFNPLQPLGEDVQADESIEESKGENEDEENVETQQAKSIECEGVRQAENGNLDESIRLFDESIAIAPNRPSGYNNRAQALRLKGDVEGAMVDLNRALELSDGCGKAARQAFCQRGLIHHIQDRKEAAEQDFQSAAKLGSSYARSMLVQLNPYAALCNQMLGEVIGKLKHRQISTES